MESANEVQAHKASLAGTPFQRSALFFDWKLTIVYNDSYPGEPTMEN